MEINMSINVNIEDLKRDIRFYGETDLDKLSVYQIQKLSELLGDTIWDVNYVKYCTDGRSEGSAKEINAEIIKFNENILKAIFPEEYWEEVINLLHKEVD